MRNTIFILLAVICQNAYPQSLCDKHVIRDYINLLDSISENYNPFEYSNRPLFIPKPNDTVIQAIKYLKKHKKKEVELFAINMLIKLYRAQLECCNQSFELFYHGQIDKDRDIILIEFIELSNLQDFISQTDFVTTEIVFTYLNNNSYLLKDHAIYEEYFKCMEIRNNLPK